MAACGVSLTKCKINGAEIPMRTIMATPHTKEIFIIRVPYNFPRFRLPAPSSFPTIIPAAPEIPALRQQMISRTTAATELAAAASTPRCPIKEEYEVNPTPQNRDAPRIGIAHFRKSRASSRFL